MAISSMAAFLRFHLRRMQKFSGSKAGDWLIIAALVRLERGSSQFILLCSSYRLSPWHWRLLTLSVSLCVDSECRLRLSAIPKLKRS